MKFCQNCGLENDEAASECKCGAALAGSGKAKARPTRPLGEQDPPGAAGLLLDPNAWRQRSKRPLRAAPGSRRFFLVPPLGDPIRLEPKDGTLVLGRDEECDIAIGSPQVSRKHLEIAFKEERPFVRDLGTMNGTRVNDLALDGERELADGDVLRFGDVQAVYRVLEPGEPVSKLHGGPDARKTTDTVPILKNALSGNLSLVPIAEIFGQLARAKASGLLVVEGHDGEIQFVDGAPTEVRFGAKTSTAALQAFQKLKKGVFRFDPRAK